MVSRKRMSFMIMVAYAMFLLVCLIRLTYWNNVTTNKALIVITTTGCLLVISDFFYFRWNINSKMVLLYNNLDKTLDECLMLASFDVDNGYRDNYFIVEYNMDTIPFLEHIKAEINSDNHKFQQIEIRLRKLKFISLLFAMGAFAVTFIALLEDGFLEALVPLQPLLTIFSFLFSL